MVTRLAKHILIIAMLAFISGVCAGAPAGAHLTEAQAIRFADAEVQRHHRDLRYYLPRSATFSPQTHLWSIGYQPQKGHADFLMQVDDRTHKVQMLMIDTW